MWQYRKDIENFSTFFLYYKKRKLGILQDEFDNIKAGYYNINNQYSGSTGGGNNGGRDVKGNL